MSTIRLDELLAGAPACAERGRLLARVAFDALWEHDLKKGAFTWAAGLCMFGYAPSEVVNTSSWWSERLHPDDRGRVLSKMDEALGGGDTSWSDEYRFRRGDGSWAWVSTRCVIQRDAQGCGDLVVASMIDVTRATDLEQQLRPFTAQLPARIWVWDRDLRVLWNLGVGFPRAGTLTRTSAEQLFGRSPDRDRALDAARRTLGGQSEIVEVELAGTAAELHLAPLRDPGRQIVGVIGIALDISSRAEPQRRVQGMQRLLLEAQRIGQVRAWEDDLRSGTVKMDRTAPGERTEPSYREYSREDAFSVIHPDDLPRLKQLRQLTIETGAPFETEYRMLLPNGSVRVMMVRGELIRDAAGQPRRIAGTSVDITERKRTEDALAKSESLLQSVLATLPVGVLVVDGNGDILLANSAYQKIWGKLLVSGTERWSRSSGTWRGSGKPVETWASERALHHGETSLKELIDIVSFDGKRKTIENSAAPVRDKNAIVGVVVVNEEVTERVRFEEELHRRLRQQAAVAQLGQSALRSAELPALFAEAVEVAARSSSFEFAEVTEGMADGSLLLRAVYGWKDDVAGTLRLAPGETLGALALADGKPRVVEDMRQEKRVAIAPVFLEQGIVSHAMVVIGPAGQPFGTFGFGTRAPRTFTEHDLNFLQSVANVLAYAIERDRSAIQLREQRRQLQMLSRRLLAAQEAERRAVARELHDDFGHVLTALKLNLQRRERDDAESIALVDGAIDRMRDLAQDLRPPLLDELGLESSLRWYFEREARRAGIELQLDLEPLAIRPSPEVETTCFRVAQEALTNTLRHARAHRVEVRLRGDAKELLMDVRDDGGGFDVSEARRRATHGGSQGLISMQERVALSGGELQMESEPGRGTIVHVRLPIGVRSGA